MKQLQIIFALIAIFTSTQLFPITDFQYLIIAHFKLTTKDLSPEEQTRCQNCRDREKQNADLDAEGIEVLGHFAGIVGNFINILQNPKNEANVGQNIGGMLHGLANIVATAIRGGHDLLDTMETDEFKKELEKMLATKAITIQNSQDL